MKKLGLLLIGFIAVGSFSSCMKEVEPYDPKFQFEVDKKLIEAYIAENFENAIFHEVEDGYGLWYEVIVPGTPGEYEYKLVENPQGDKQIEWPTIQVKYTGKLLNGQQFDKNRSEDGDSFSLGAGIISAWQIMFLPRRIEGEDVLGVLPQGLHPGAKVRFVAPSIFGYRDVNYGAIPSNSPLDFTVEVVSVRAPSSN